MLSYVVYCFLFWKMKAAKILWFGSCLRHTLSLYFCSLNGLQTSLTVRLLCILLKPL